MSIADSLSRLPPRTQRALALLSVPIAIASLWIAFFWPLTQLYQAQVQWRTNAEGELSHQRGVATLATSVRDQLDAIPSLKSLQRLYPAGAESSIALALQSDISGALSASRARLQSFTPLGATRVGALSKVGLQVSAFMSIDQLREFLGQVHSLSRLVRIERLSITAPSMQSPQENPTLNVTFDAFGFAP